MNKDELEEVKRAALEHRKKSFGVKIEPTHIPWLREKEFDVHITHNGFQWQVISMTDAEMIKVRDAINEHLKNQGLA